MWGRSILLIIYETIIDPSHGVDCLDCNGMAVKGCLAILLVWRSAKLSHHERHPRQSKQLSKIAICMPPCSQGDKQRSTICQKCCHGIIRRRRNLLRVPCAKGVRSPYVVRSRPDSVCSERCPDVARATEVMTKKSIVGISIV